jgi:hypothetical protein
VRVRVAGIDAAKVGQQRDETTVALVDAVADAMRALNFRPTENFIRRPGINHFKIHQRERKR